MERDGDSPKWDAPAKVHGTVHRVDNPAIARVRALDDSRLLGTDGMRRESLTETLYNQLLTC